MSKKDLYPKVLLGISLAKELIEKTEKNTESKDENLNVLVTSFQYIALALVERGLNVEQVQFLALGTLEIIEKERIKQSAN